VSSYLGGTSAAALCLPAGRRETFIVLISKEGRECASLFRIYINIRMSNVSLKIILKFVIHRAGILLNYTVCTSVVCVGM